MSHQLPFPESSSATSHKRRRLVKEEEHDNIVLQERPPITPDILSLLMPHENLGFTPSPEQQQALDVILAGNNTFVTGSAGSGKTMLLKAAICSLRAAKKRVRIAAPTGKAAWNAGGTTLHSLFGLSPRDNTQPIRKLEHMAETRDQVRKRLVATDVLIIDEISMVENIFFEKINRMMQAARETAEPFGGAQIVVCGDFRQLPPVLPFSNCFHCGGATEKVRERKVTIFRCKNCRGEEEDPDQWAFCSAAWTYAEFTNVNLTENHRQNDNDLVQILTTLSRGKALSRSDKDLLFEHPCEVEGAVHLYPNNTNVDAMNAQKYDALSAEIMQFNCLDNFRWNPKDVSLEYLGRKSADGRTLRALCEHHYKETLNLKLGEPVVLTANVNVERGLVNGCQGIIESFETYAIPPSSGREIDQTRLKTGELPDQSERPGTSVRGGDYAAYRREQVATLSSSLCLPVVRFHNGNTVPIFPDCSVTQLGDDHPFTLLSRTQIPLTAGWAMTIHKAQGMTMDKVVVHIPKGSLYFTARHAYVALSRARSLSGLMVRGHRGGLDVVEAQDKVKDFMLDTDWYIG